MSHEYNANLKIDVKSKFINVDMEMTYCSLEEDKEEVIFYLYHELEIEKLKGKRIKSYIIEAEKFNCSSFNYPGQKVKVMLDKPLAKGDKLNIEMSYSGHFNSKGIKFEGGEDQEIIQLNRIENGFVELGMYAPWFPFFENYLEPAIFNLNIVIDDGYKVVSRPQVIKDNGNYIIEQEDPFGDCTIIAFNNFKCFEFNNADIKSSVYYINEEHKETAINSKELTEKLINYYNSQFGKTARDRVNIVITPRKNGGHYCRPGLLVYSAEIAGSSELKLFRNLGHEIAHFWWNKAEFTSWEDWLNESFANYSVLKAVRNYYGIDKYNEIIDKYQENAKNLPPIRGLKRDTSQETFLTLYCKGTLKLLELEKMLGESKQLKLLRKVHQNEIKTTSEFLELLRNFSSTQIAEKFNKMLDD
ncbi:MAG: M1 family aminopeptidase [bacterium]